MVSFTGYACAAVRKTRSTKIPGLDTKRTCRSLEIKKKKLLRLSHLKEGYIENIPPFSNSPWKENL
jgi:hypothetical protein